MSALSNVPVSFKDWASVLNDDTELTNDRKEPYRCAIVAYLHHLKTRHERASVTSAKAYVEASSTRSLPGSIEREALRWFFRAAQKWNGPRRVLDIEDHVSPIIPEKADQGKTPWERRLIERLRVGQYPWRTEMTYRDWAWRFADWLGSRSIENATDEDITGFLSYLAVERTVAAATQRQALNALVFFFKDGIAWTRNHHFGHRKP